MKTYILSLDELDDFVKKLPKEGIILLCGNLASGKTTLTKKIALNLGIEDEIISPTFNIMQSYDDILYHYDIYNDGTKKLLETGLFENLFEDGLHVVEWADKSLENLLNENSLNYIKITITPFEDKRKYEVVRA
ncbi:tRNA (adenosine(37)-N6)-threonylcarbamoyltransferase complex ATPase subunit type 1 TsaE [Campylobacter sp. RM12327]|uniref:tRNA (adenosine(37)-N6)-threonylcarbamoyltransferase complex ATPase subunit type 1 TsaE n=1 Tax=Campylobacter sputorum TaxID=206 RepID=UPI000B798FF2|nr:MULTISPECIES: tRNA (adenosine(37)-N6)-threonylcarbamoyltransferase complex ATPase subunit type 1 TsaE [Campylobacter]ASM40362.1 N6-L-threonylcarbamoyladenine synthase, TsaE subunit [Campylobacter sputorum]MBE7357365.1 tRNA (adenosine(37)-N6)-threonylcarbamoyltransferase complex ATPase subunit type 1 TsaE [Campylobacter sp. RM11302]MBF6668675.1 tRNA (adenosine(37)-N6)-threonylcarbamoyltransferase complex ATPase subunit type 1 TsaE [Campylobacter sp. RM12327]MBF6674069.1 tRNA (adenosine(37)-N6